MYQVESFSVWIYDNSNREKTCSYQKKPKYVFSRNRPCDLPKCGFVRLSVTCDETRQHLAGIEAEYFYGSKTNEVLTCKYTAEELLAIENSLVGEGSFLDRIAAQINRLTPCQQRDLIDVFGIPCFGSHMATLIHLFIFLLAILSIIIAWLNVPCFWENKLLPLYVRFPTSKYVISRRILKLLDIYIIYLYSMGIEIGLRPLLDAILVFVNTWPDPVICGEDLDVDFFYAQLNLGFYKYIMWQIESNFCEKIEPKQIEKEVCNVSSDVFTLSSEQDSDPVVCQKFLGEDADKKYDPATLSFLTEDSVESKSCSSFVTCDNVNKCCKVDQLENCVVPSSAVDSITSSFVTKDSCDLRSQDPRPSCQPLKSKKRKVKEIPCRDNKSPPHLPTLSHEVIGYAMTEVRNRLDGCLEEYVHRSYPRIESYIQAALREKGDYFFLLKEQLDLEVSRVREVCQQALLALEAVPHYEERIRHLENEVKALKSGRNDETDLHRKVEHLQSTVTQLLKAVRCRV